MEQIFRQLRSSDGLHSKQQHKHLFLDCHSSHSSLSMAETHLASHTQPVCSSFIYISHMHAGGSVLLLAALNANSEPEVVGRKV